MTHSSQMITLFGATGYTGQLIAQSLDAAGLPYRLAGRSADRLARLSAALPSRPSWLVADAAQPGSLPPLFQDTRLLINCAGPFTDLGERVIAQAAMGGVHYLDITNELGYVFRARTYHEMAHRTGAALVPACGFEVALADCAASLVGSALTGPREEALDAINVVYALSGKGASAGTRRSAVRSLATSWIAYREGDWTGQMPGRRVRRFALPDGARHALSFPSAESVTIPAHLPVGRVDTWMATTRGARFWAPVVIPLFARLSRSILRGLILKIASKGGFSPAGALDVGLRADSPFTVYVEVRRGTDLCWMALSGQDPYGLTARIITYAAERIGSQDTGDRASSEAEGSRRIDGLLAPAQALDPQALIDYAQKNWGVVVRQGMHAG